MSKTAESLFQEAFPYVDDVLALAVVDVDQAAAWYSHAFAMTEVERRTTPTPQVVLEREGVRIGFAQNGGDPSQDGAAIRVSDAAQARDELESRGITTASWRVDERDGERFQVFFVVAPDGLCFYFHERLEP